MTTRQYHRPFQQLRGIAPRWLSAALVVVIAGVLAVVGTAAPAAAAVPGVAQRWTSLMQQSLTPSPAYVALRKKLAAQRATLATRVTRMAKDRSTHDAAQTALTSAVSADAAARTRSAVAREALISAKNTLTVVSQQRPRSGAAMSAATNAVTAATTALTADRSQARLAATKLRTAQVAARTATTGLDSAITAWRTTSTAVRTNQQRLIALDKSAALAAQAAGLSRDVVTQVRAGFTVADTTTVNGITVHKSVAFAFRRMITDAKSAGIVLSGGGFRTKQRQIELRRSNGCPDVWTAPASSCRVPTAIPGRSLHEIGLAVDITAGGSSLTSASPGFKWLVANAAKYGYVNLPSEPWHWSITGG
jgi:D-alanyl-D-alanine carboxypeptidase